MLKIFKIENASRNYFTKYNFYMSHNDESFCESKKITELNGELINIPTPFSSSCLNSVEICMIVFMALVYATGLPLLISLLWKLYQELLF